MLACGNEATGGLPSGDELLSFPQLSKDSLLGGLFLTIVMV